MKKQYNTHLWIATAIFVVLIITYILLDILNPPKPTSAGLGSLQNLDRALMLFPFMILVPISLVITVMMFIYDACVCLKTPKEKALWIVLLILFSVIAFPTYIIINGQRPRPEPKAAENANELQPEATDENSSKTATGCVEIACEASPDAENASVSSPAPCPKSTIGEVSDDNHTDMWILAFLPQLLMLCFLILRLLSLREIYYFLEIAVVAVILFEIAAIIRFVFDASERIPKGRQRTKWLWLLVFLSPIACPAYYILFSPKHPTEKEEQ